MVVAAGWCRGWWGRERRGGETPGLLARALPGPRHGHPGHQPGAVPGATGGCSNSPQAGAACSPVSAGSAHLTTSAFLFLHQVTSIYNCHASPNTLATLRCLHSLNLQGPNPPGASRPPGMLGLRHYNVKHCRVRSSASLVTMQKMRANSSGSTVQTYVLGNSQATCKMQSGICGHRLRRGCLISRALSRAVHKSDLCIKGKGLPWDEHSSQILCTLQRLGLLVRIQPPLQRKRQSNTRVQHSTVERIPSSFCLFK